MTVPFNNLADIEAHRSGLLKTDRPYLQVFSLFGLTPPPIFFDRRNLGVT